VTAADLTDALRGRERDRAVSRPGTGGVAAGASSLGSATTFVPRILVFSTNTISDPGIDLAGSSHLHYPPSVLTISLPCTSGIRPGWILHALERGFDGVFVASDGDECAFLPDCSSRSARIVAEAQALMDEAGLDKQRLRMAAICSVCAAPFTKHVRDFFDALVALGPVERA
jgi:coenzyme F420-reducing hydrogenase delta subunit